MSAEPWWWSASVVHKGRLCKLSSRIALRGSIWAGNRCDIRRRRLCWGTIRWAARCYIYGRRLGWGTIGYKPTGVTYVVVVAGV